MSDNKPRAEAADFSKVLARLEALEKLVANPVATLKTRAELEAEAERQRIAEKRAKLKAATKKEGGLAYYRIPTPHYRQGVRYEAGSVVAIPIDEEPSHTWSPVEPEQKAPKHIA